MQTVIVVCGPTATGKSDYAVNLARDLAKEGFGTEIISADSRQVYRGLTIGSGKITAKEMKGVPHHLIDVANPKRTFSVAQYKKLAEKAIKAILKKSKTPIIVGGTGFYIDTLLFDQQLPEVPPNKKLRAVLETCSLEELRDRLQELDPERYETIDTKNAVRLIRAIEIAEALGKVPKTTRKSSYDIQWVYLDFPDEQLKGRIHNRLLRRMRQGMIAEVQRLHDNGLSWKRLEALGLEYRFIALYLQKKLTKAQMLEQLEHSIWKYAKRQRTWFKKYAILTS